MAQTCSTTTMKMASLPLLPLEECSRSNFDAPSLLPRWSRDTTNDILSKREAPSMTSRRSPSSLQGQASFDVTANDRPAKAPLSTTDLFIPLQGPSIVFLDAHCRTTFTVNPPPPPPIPNLKPRKQTELSTTTPESETTSVSHLCLHKQSNGATLIPNKDASKHPNHTTNPKRGDFHNLPKFPSLSSAVADENTEAPLSFSQTVPTKRYRGAAPMLPLL